MKETEIIKDIMKNSTPKVTMDVLAERMGFASKSGVSERLRGQGMRLESFLRFMDALGYEVIVQPKTARPAKDGSYKVGEDE